MKRLVTLAGRKGTVTQAITITLASTKTRSLLVAFFQKHVSRPMMKRTSAMLRS